MPEVEEWCFIPGYEGIYEVSDHGEVRSVVRTVRTGRGTRRVSARTLRQFTREDGRPTVNLSKENHQILRLVHQVVLEAFVGPRPGGADCCHGDGDVTNNHISNLRWDTRSANAQDTIRHGHNHQLNKTHCPRAHLLIAPNLKPAQLAQGSRSCLACSREFESARRQRRPFDPARADERLVAIMSAP